jgi:hypothetical protein
MLHERARQHPEQSLEVDFAVVHAGLGEFDAVFRYLDAGAEKHLAEVLFSVNSVMWENVRKHPEYWDIARRHGLVRIAREIPEQFV